MSLLEQNIIRKKRVDNNITELNAVDDKNEYEIKAICDSTVYIKELANYLSRFYYLISWKSYLEEENT